MFAWTKAGGVGYQPIVNHSVSGLVNKANAAVAATQANSPNPTVTANPAFDSYQTVVGPFPLSRGRQSGDFDDVYIKLDRPRPVSDIKLVFYCDNTKTHNGLELTANYVVRKHRFPYRLVTRTRQASLEMGYWLSGSESTINKATFVTAEQLANLGLTASLAQAAVRSVAGDCDYTFSEVLSDDDIVSELVILISTKSASYTWPQGGYRDGDTLYVGGPIRLGN